MIDFPQRPRAVDDVLRHPGFQVLRKDLQSMVAMATERLRAACASSNDPKVRELTAELQMLEKTLAHLTPPKGSDDDE